jgi:hypothetical protein
VIDLDTSAKKSPRAARLCRLLRAAIGDERLLRGEALEEVCARVGARQVPAANLSLVDETVTRLKPWPSSALFEELRDALKAGRPIEQNHPWTLAWPQPSGRSMMLSGAADIVYLDGQRRWRPVSVSALAETAPDDRLRLLFSALDARRRALEPCGPGWHVCLGTDGFMLSGVDVEVDPASLEQALANWLRSHFATRESGGPLPS